MTVAKSLISSGMNVYGIFFLHLAMEKALKAHVVKTTNEIPPKTHNLNRLMVLAKLEVPTEMEDFFADLMPYLIEGRYAEFYPSKPSDKVAESYLSTTKTYVKWLIERL